jgi:pyridoxamine 5'-phosphate oxidase family protein
MSVFTANEVAYLRGHHLGRLATVGAQCRPQVVPTGYNFDAEGECIEIGAHNLPDRGQKRRYRSNIEGNPNVAFVVDDMASADSWAPRGLSIRGVAEIVMEGGERLAPGFGPIWVRIMPTWISSWGIDTSSFEPPNTRRVR